MINQKLQDEWVQGNGFVIMRTPTGIGVMAVPGTMMPRRPVRVEVEYRFTEYKDEIIDSHVPWRDCFPEEIMAECVIRVKEIDGTILAELGKEPLNAEWQAFFVHHGPQTFITENWVSVPPALHITDEYGSVWTLGFEAMPKSLSPKGEFAFKVLRDGIDLDEVCSRIERRNGKIRIFTKTGWKNWTGRTFI